jgi:hypothetical protein
LFTIMLRPQYTAETRPLVKKVREVGLIGILVARGRFARTAAETPLCDRITSQGLHVYAAEVWDSCLV